MEVILTVLAVFLILVVLGFLVFLFQRLRQLEIDLRGEEILQRLELHKGELGANLRSLDERLHAVTTEIGGVKEVTAQLREFQESLRSQKRRGKVGEAVLEDLLRQVLPTDRFEMQYAFRNRKVVDAVVKTSAGVLVPVDSKFPVESFQRFSSAQSERDKQSAWREFVGGVKSQMEETAQYIIPEENTSPFALMYIPFEPIFQEVVSDSELWKYALAKRVYFTSPQTFWTTLQFLYIGLQRLNFADQVEEVLQMIHAVAKDAEDFDTLLQTSAKQVNDAGNNMAKLTVVFSGLLDKLEQLTDLKAKPKESK